MAGWGSAIRNNTLYALNRQMDRITRLQEQLTSGLRVIRSSDAPADASRIMSLQTETRSLATYARNLETTSFNVGHVSGALQELNNNITRAKELTTQAASGTYNPDNRAAMGRSIDSILENIVSLLNSKTMGRYLFSGTRVNQAPYAAARTDGRITDVTYQGSHERMRSPVAPGVDYPTTVVGDEMFRSSDAGQAAFPAGLTGAAPGDGTPSARGDFFLTVTHEATGYTDDGPATGITAAANSGPADTIIGTHTLTIQTGATNTIQLDGGEPVPFTNETGLRVANENGDVAYVDVSGWTGSAGTITLDATGTLSIDGGRTTTPIDFSANQAVTDNQGHVLYVDSTDVARAGAEPVRVSGSYDLFHTLMYTRDVLLNESGVDENRQSELLGKAIESLGELQAGVTQKMTSVGAQVEATDDLSASLEELKYNAESQKSKLQDADIAQVAADFANYQTLYRMSLEASSRLLSISLLDFL